WSAAGPASPKKQDYPPYVENGGESARGLHAVRVLSNKKDFTLDSLIAAAFDSYLTWFEKPMPALIKAWDNTPDSNPLKARVADQIALLRKWDLRWGSSSISTSLAVFWGDDVRRRVGGGGRRGGGGTGGPSIEDAIAAAPPEQLLQALAAATDKLENDFGTWRTPWGDINRFQRLTGDIVQPFTDAGPSIPVGFTSSQWGSLASFGARAYPGTKKWYGTSGNSFVAVVEFGGKVHAKAVTAGGESGHPESHHFNDEAARYATGALREVYFYPSQLKGHTEREYHPGS
ncbi:MAG TPA: penicillin acylase family protein, partial [Candidatus Sulfopaludibacter sp.]|nr:penicillin acylase family protein [Candidatus Sulfopaludibacter sp.]